MSFTKHSKSNIGIHLKDFLPWNGGIDFIENIIIALSLLKKKNSNINVILLVEVNFGYNFVQSSAELNILNSINLISISELFLDPYNSLTINNREGLEDLLIRNLSDCNLPIGLYHDRPWGLKIACIKYKIKLILPTLSIVNVHSETQVISYIYDLQHIHQPYNFSANEKIVRNNQFSEFIKQSCAILCNSNFTAKSIREKYQLPQKQTLIILPFAPFHKSWWKLPSDKEVLSKYKIKNKYIIVCNQFWVHKNNILALKAFLNLNQINKDLTLIFTGKLSDYRDNKHIIDFTQLVKNNNHLDIQVSGQLPKLDQLALLKNAEILIQPTRYEGGPGGGAVYDAMSLGTPVVLSDIEINKECDMDNYPIYYFKNNNSESLAKQLKIALESDKKNKPVNRLNALIQTFEKFL